MRKWLNKFRRLPNVRDWFEKNWQWWGTVPRPEDPNLRAKGRLMWVDGETEPVLVERVTGNVNDPKKYEINGKHLVGMLDFYLQLNENRRPTKEELEEWDSIELVQIDPPESKRKLSPKENQ